MELLINDMKFWVTLIFLSIFNWFSGVMLLW